MAFVISSVMPFPNILWWCKVLQANELVWDVQEHFEKMTLRNRYHIAGASGALKMSIPIEGGREHKSVMGKTCIANSDKWQQQHWRTIVSAYANTPYFDHYAASLEALFIEPYKLLTDFSLASVQWLQRQLKISLNESFAATYCKDHPDAIHDLRTRAALAPHPGFPPYYQVFQERTGFIPNLSLLDLLFSEGPHTLHWLRENSRMVLGKSF